ncbi:MAG TPA: hypothetical protein DCY13_14330 [Verrucomicrobiales bacterium]|nr:hypothetical protein [Verrucomicrobiales bacterium]
MNDWNIQSRAHACQACGGEFADKQRYHTVLSDERSDYIRLDVCEKCWAEQYAEGARDRKGFISCWQGVYEAPPAAPPDPIQRDTAESLLRKLIELNDPQYAAASYILAVMLERKRQLRVKEQFKRDGRRVFVYEQPKTFDLFTIPDPDLQLDQLDEVQSQVAHLLEHGLNPPADAGPDATEPVAAPEPAAEEDAEVPASAAEESSEAGPIPASR